MTKNLARRSGRSPQPPATTDRQRLEAVFAGLAGAGVAYWFDLRGATGAREDRYNDYIRAAELAGTELWVGEHIGNVDFGGGFWGDDGRLYAGRRTGEHVLYREMWWSFNHEHPQLAELLVRLFREQGIDASWSGDTHDSVIVDLQHARAVERAD